MRRLRSNCRVSLLATSFVSASAVAQPRDEAALHGLAVEILEAVHEATGCRFAILWPRFDPRTGTWMVRVRGTMESCEGALEQANRLGRDSRVAFATLATLGEAPRIEPRTPPRADPPEPFLDRGPRNLDLIHEVIE